MVRQTLLLALVLAPCIANAQYTITLSEPTGAIVVGDPVKVQVTLENVSKENLTIVKDRASEWGEKTYEVAVVTTTGASVALTPYGRALNHLFTMPPIPIRGSPYEVALKPQEKVVDTILLSKIYDFTPGTYIVRVRKETIPNTPEPAIVSNILRLTIAPNRTSRALPFSRFLREGGAVLSTCNSHFGNNRTFPPHITDSLPHHPLS